MQLMYNFSIMNTLYKKVSVIVPNYNYAQYLEARLTSIEAQSYPIFEIIFLDDASSDESLEIAQRFLKYSKIPMSITINESNSGSVFKQWIKGLKIAKGDHIWIAEADDLSAPDFLEKVMAGFDNEEVTLSYSMSKVIDNHAHVIQKHYRSGTDDIDLEKWKSAYTRDGEAEIYDTFVIKNTIPNASSVVFKHIDISAIEEKLSTFKVAGDWYFYCWLLQQGKIAYVPEALNLWRRHGSSVSGKPEHNQIHYRELIQMQEEICQSYSVTAKTWEKALQHRSMMKAWLKIYNISIEKYLFIISYEESGSEQLLNILNTAPHIEIRGENMGLLFDLYKTYRDADKATAFATKQSADDTKHPWFGINNVNADYFTSKLCDTFVNEVLTPSSSTSISGFKEIRFLDYSRQELNGYLAFLFHFFPHCRVVFHRRNIEEVIKFGWMKKHKNALQQLDDWMIQAQEQYGDAILTTHYHDMEDSSRLSEKLSSYLNH